MNRRRVLSVAVTAIVVAISLATPGFAAASHRLKEPFCKSRVLRDFEAPLRRLPEVREPGGWLPFAPRKISLFAKSESVVIGGDPIEYGFELPGIVTEGRRLDWDVVSRLVRIDRRGRDIEVVKAQRRHVGPIELVYRVELGFKRSPRPGLYRYDISFASGDGTPLGEYRAHYVVVRRDLEIRLRLNATSFRPGDRILAKIENFRASGYGYGLDYWIQRRDGADWEPVSFEELFGHRVRFPRVRRGTGAGMSGPCSASLTVPETMAPGRYRLVKQISWREAPRFLIAELTIRPPA